MTPMVRHTKPCETLIKLHLHAILVHAYEVLWFVCFQNYKKETCPGAPLWHKEVIRLSLFRITISMTVVRRLLLFLYDRCR